MLRDKRIAVGADHGGYGLKCTLIEKLRGSGIDIVDFGTDSRESCDYPDIARRVCGAVVSGECAGAILVCGTGVGMSIAANKIPGIRAACLSDVFSAKLTRQHNDANVLCIGERVVGPGLALELCEAFLSAEFEGGGRHSARIAKIADIEKNGL